jgi:hypothetical protein
VGAGALPVVTHGGLLGAQRLTEGLEQLAILEGTAVGITAAFSAFSRGFSRFPGGAPQERILGRVNDVVLFVGVDARQVGGVGAFSVGAGVEQGCQCATAGARLVSEQIGKGERREAPCAAHAVLGISAHEPRTEGRVTLQPIAAVAGRERLWWEAEQALVDPQVEGPQGAFRARAEGAIDPREVEAVVPREPVVHQQIGPQVLHERGEVLARGQAAPDAGHGAAVIVEVLREEDVVAHLVGEDLEREPPDAAFLHLGQRHHDGVVDVADHREAAVEPLSLCVFLGQAQSGQGQPRVSAPAGERGLPASEPFVAQRLAASHRAEPWRPGGCDGSAPR